MTTPGGLVTESERGATSLPVVLQADEYRVAFAHACDAVERALNGPYDPDDGLLHTSDEARAAAHAVFCAVGIIEKASDYPPPADLPGELWGAWNACADMHHGDLAAFYRYLERLKEHRRRRDSAG